MKVSLKLISLALFGAAAGVSAHTDLRGGFFPPEEMDEKRNASQKRQDQRDARRARDNPNRSQDEEQRERQRKNKQSRSRDKPCADPSDPYCGDEDYTQGRERGRVQRCNRNGESCNYHRSQNDPNPERRRVDRNCINDCSAGDSGCESLDDDDRYETCVNRCERNCSEQVNIKDVRYIIGFLEEFQGQDHKFINDFLAFDGEEDKED